MKKVLKYLILILFTITTFGLLYYVNKLNILKSTYFVILSILVLLIWLLVFTRIKSNKTKIVTKVIFSIIACTLSCGYIFSSSYINNTVKFINNITKKNSYQTQSYSVLVSNTSNYNSIEDLIDKNIGFISTNNNLEKVTYKLKDKINYNEVDYEDVTTAILNINSNIDAIVLEDSFIETLEDNNVEFINNSRKIYTFSIKVKKGNVNKVNNINEDPFILYISGSDSRGSISETARSDVNIIVVVNPKTNKILLVNVPRDYYVQLHGTTGIKDKLTHAGLYGLDMSKMTMQDLLDININYSVKVGFDTVVDIVDALDGIDLDIDQALTLKSSDNKKYCKYTVGMNHLDGACALRYARERKSYVGGDRHRGRNQQQVITAIINKLKEPKYLIKYNDILKAAEGTFETDLTYEEITSLVKYQMSNLTDWQIESISADGTDIMTQTYSIPGMTLSVMVPDEQILSDVKIKIKEYMK